METHFAKPLIKRTLHNLEQLKQVLLHTFSSERSGFYLPRSSKGSVSVCIKYAVGSVPHFFFLFFLRRHKKQDPSRGAYRETKSYQRLEGKRETGSGKRPVSPHLQPEPRLKCSSQHRRPMTHIEADKAPARVSEPSAGERERGRKCAKKKKQANLQRPASEKRKCQSRL